MDDPELIEKVAQMSAACIVVTKPERNLAWLDGLRLLNERTPGMPIRAFVELSGPLGNVDDVIGFAPYRLWISSANFTRASRRNLEFGFWTEEPDLMQGVRNFLVKLIGASEALDPESDVFEPDLASAKFDNDAMAEASAESLLDEDDDDDPT
ncbi:MAG: hypothetical protein ACREX3_04195 [Gammaproteobacteria bacterium]